jgi:hypothetical protein
LNNITATATIDPAFVSSKVQASSPVNTDQLLILRVDNTYARLLYGSAFNQDVLRKAVGPIGGTSAVINGDMSVWQRNTTFNNVANTAYTADRWRCDYVMATGKVNITQLDLSGSLVGTVNNHQPKYALRATVATLQASLLSTEFFTISQRIEKQRARKLFDNPSSLEIWFRTSITGTYSVVLRNADTSQFYKRDVSIGTPNVWQRVTIENIAAMPTGSGSWGTNETDMSYIISVCLAGGSNFQATQQNAWTSGNMLCTASQTNFIDNAAATFDMCLCQHEPGTVCSSFLPMDLDDSLFYCQRYHCKSWALGTAEGTATTINDCYSTAISASATPGIQFPVRMRAVPTLTIYNPATGASGAAAGCTTAVSTASTLGEYSMGLLTLTGATAGAAVAFHYVADAEL